MSTSAGPEFWEPGPLRPGPFPAPSVRYFLAPSGNLGRRVDSTSQCASLVGQGESCEVAAAPALPVGAGKSFMALEKAANSGSSVRAPFCALSLILTMPNLFSSYVYSYMRPPE